MCEGNRSSYWQCRELRVSLALAVDVQEKPWRKKVSVEEPMKPSCVFDYARYDALEQQYVHIRHGVAVAEHLPTTSKCWVYQGTLVC